MTCPECTAVYEQTRLYCGKCRAVIGRRCVHCGFVNLADDLYCGQCSQSLAQEAPAATPAAPMPPATKKDILSEAAADHNLFVRLSSNLQQHDINDIFEDKSEP